MVVEEERKETQRGLDEEKSDNEAKARAGRVGGAMESCTPWEVVMLVR